MSTLPGVDERLDWIDSMTDAECMEVFWLYVDPPEPFLARYPAPLLGAALRRALRAVALGEGGAGSAAAVRRSI